MNRDDADMWAYLSSLGDSINTQKNIINNLKLLIVDIDKRLIVLEKKLVEENC